VSLAAATGHLDRSPRDRARDAALPAMALIVIVGAIAVGVLASDSPVLVVAGASTLLLGLAIILRPDTATLTTIAILYSNAAVIAVRFHGVPLFVAGVVPMLLVIPLARDLILQRLPVIAPPMLPLMTVLLLVHVVSALFSTDTTTTFDAVVVFAVEGFGLYFLLINVIRTPEMLRQVTWGLVAVGALVSLPSIHQDLTNNFDSNYFGFAQAADASFRTGTSTLAGDVLQRRLAGSVGETNRFAQIMLMLVPLGIFRFVGERALLLRVLAGICTALITISVILTFSRGAAVGLALLVAALAALRMVRRPHLISIGLALVLLFGAFPQYLTRVASLGSFGALAGGSGVGSDIDGALLSRATETLAAALVIVDHPVIGVGPDMFPVFYEQYAEIVGILVRNDAAREAHNLYLGIGAELGVTGLIVFLMIALVTVRMILLARRQSLGRRPDLERLTTPFLLSIMVYHVTGVFLHLSFGRFYWLILAVAGAAAVITLREMATRNAVEAADGGGPPR
jgi:putative inorganic carbon (hco3(-)) transporter